MLKSLYRMVLASVLSVFMTITSMDAGYAQETRSQWIQPASASEPMVWGIKGGITFSLWPDPLESARQGEGGPRGLIRVGCEVNGMIYQLNYIAAEPVVGGKIEYSEITESRVDNKLGKIFWPSNDTIDGGFHPRKLCRGTISHPDPKNIQIEELSIYVFTEQFLNGAHPYFRLFIRSNKPSELGIQVFNQKGSALMDRCAFTATMGNYARLRHLYLKDEVVDAKKLFGDFNGINFIEKQSYPAELLLKSKADGSLVAFAESDEPLNELAAWPQTPAYLERWSWRYRPFFKVIQYWRVPEAAANKDLVVRVNGRKNYWAGMTSDPSKYIPIPGGVAFENFEMRVPYVQGQEFFFGISRKSIADLMGELR
ncbi:MAG TPA: hypothetical protein VGN00_09120 [Puia sp.]|jgi:hypothetical protein